MEHLLSRLEIDSAPVVRRLMTLLFPSFLPLDKSEQEQVPRCVALIQTNPGAARVFYRYSQHFMDVQQTGETLTWGNSSVYEILCNYFNLWGSFTCTSKYYFIGYM